MKKSRQNIPQISHFLAFQEALACRASPAGAQKAGTLHGCLSRRVHTPSLRLPAYQSSKILRFLPSTGGTRLMSNILAQEAL